MQALFMARDSKEGLLAKLRKQQVINVLFSACTDISFFPECCFLIEVIAHRVLPEYIPFVMEAPPSPQMDERTRLLMKNPFSDVKFEFPLFPGRVVYGHRFTLMMKNSFFLRMFSSGMLEGAPGMVTIPLEDDPEAFQLFLHFLYSEKIDVSSADAPLLWELLEIGDKYECKKMHEICSKRFLFLLQETADVPTVICALEHAHKFGIQPIIQWCIEWIMTEMEWVGGTEEGKAVFLPEQSENDFGSDENAEGRSDIKRANEYFKLMRERLEECLK